MAAFSDQWMCSYTQNRRPLHEDCLVRFWYPWQDSGIEKNYDRGKGLKRNHLKRKRILRSLIKSDQWGGVIGHVLTYFWLLRALVTGSVFPTQETGNRKKKHWWRVLKLLIVCGSPYFCIQTSFNCADGVTRRQESVNWKKVINNLRSMSSNERY